MGQTLALLDRKVKVIGFTLLALAVDEIFKYYLFNFDPGFTLVNQNLAFSVGQSWYVGLGFILLGVVAFYTKAKPQLAWLGLTLATVANTVDRFFAGGVIDYLHIARLHLNLADLLICFFIGWIMFFTIKKEA